MTCRIISFLGTSARETTYEYQGRTYQGSVFQMALRQMLDFDEMLVFVTEKARQKTYPVLEQLNDNRIRPVDICEGRTSAELWSIFDKLVSNVDERDQVIFDLTHGLRSIPFLVFLAAAYLRSAKNIELKKVLYGALDLQQESVAPVIDLTEFVILLDWLTATDLFIRTGDASVLAQRLTEADDGALLGLAVTVAEIAQGLHLLRPSQITRAAAELPARLASAQEVLPSPFTLLAESLGSSYGRFGLDQAANRRDKIRRHLDLINWYHNRGQLVHTLSAAREWVVSLLCYHFNLDEEDKANRDEMEFLIGGGKKRAADGSIERESPYLQYWNSVPESTRLRRLWQVEPNGLAHVRNDVLHCGFRKGTRPAQEIVKVTKGIVEEINVIADKWGLFTNDEQAQGEGHL